MEQDLKSYPLQLDMELSVYLQGEILSENGFVGVEIHKAFRFLLGIILLLPLIGVILLYINESERFTPFFVLVAVVQILLIRFVFIGLAFRFLSNSSLNRFRDVLDIEWIEN